MNEFSSPFLQRLRDYCMSKPNAGTAGPGAFEIREIGFRWDFGFERIFAGFDLDKTPASLFVTASHETVQAVPPRYAAVRHVKAEYRIKDRPLLEILLDESMPEAEIMRLIDESHALVLGDLTLNEQAITAIDASAAPPSEKLRLLADAYDLGHRQAEIERLVRKPTALRSRPPQELPLGQSRLGGLPDLPNGVEWPLFNGKPLAFVAQLNLSEIPPEVEVDHDLLPREGMLSFFTVFGWQQPDGDIHRDTPWGSVEPAATKVFYFKETAALRRAASLSGEFKVFLSAPLDFVNVLSLPAADEWNRDPVMYELDWLEEEIERFSYLEFNFGLIHDNALGWGSPYYHLLGYAGPIQEAVTRPGMELLLQLEQDHNAGMEWGDAYLYFVAPRADLLRRDFSNVMCEHQSG